MLAADPDETAASCHQEQHGLGRVMLVHLAVGIE
jgi:hypothetical protein